MWVSHRSSGELRGGVSRPGTGSGSFRGGSPGPRKRWGCPAAAKPRGAALGRRSSLAAGDDHSIPLTKVASRSCPFWAFGVTMPVLPGKRTRLCRCSDSHRGCSWKGLRAYSRVASWNLLRRSAPAGARGFAAQLIRSGKNGCAGRAFAQVKTAFPWSVRRDGQRAAGRLIGAGSEDQQAF